MITACHQLESPDRVEEAARGSSTWSTFGTPFAHHHQTTHTECRPTSFGFSAGRRQPAVFLNMRVPGREGAAEPNGQRGRQQAAAPRANDQQSSAAVHPVSVPEAQVSSRGRCLSCQPSSFWSHSSYRGIRLLWTISRTSLSATLLRAVCLLEEARFSRKPSDH